MCLRFKMQPIWLWILRFLDGEWQVCCAKGFPNWLPMTDLPVRGSSFVEISRFQLYTSVSCSKSLHAVISLLASAFRCHAGPTLCCSYRVLPLQPLTQSAATHPPCSPPLPPSLKHVQYLPMHFAKPSLGGCRYLDRSQSMFVAFMTGFKYSLGSLDDPKLSTSAWVNPEKQK
jgi:hypothetical protein